MTAHPHDERVCYSMGTGKGFMESYKEGKGSEEVVDIDLQKEKIGEIDGDVLGGWGKVECGGGLDRV